MHRPFPAVRVIAAGLTAVLPAIGVAGAVRAEEPLFLRIRPADDRTVGLGASGPSEDDRALAAARAARARSEAVWQRAEERSRIAIASVCTGCLAAVRAPAAAPVAPSVRPPVESRVLAGDSAQDATRDIATAAFPAVPRPPLTQADAP